MVVPLFQPFEALAQLALARAWVQGLVWGQFVWPQVRALAPGLVRQVLREASRRAL